MKKIPLLFLIVTCCFCLDSFGQRRQPSLLPSADRIDKEMDKIFGICGCTDCVGRLEHNDPFEDDFTGFSLGNRWTSTALSGGGLTQGTPTMITWSIVPDGTDANGGGGFVPSNMIAVFDSLFNEPNAGNPDLTTRNWFSRMQQALDRWSEVSGVEYVYEPNDDGTANFGAGGVVGVRGDVRIGGYNIDGGGNVLAFNQFPNSGDMAIDTSDTGTLGNSFANFRLFRNVITHEQGHGLGFFHVESNNAAFLMEPFISGGFDGPQLDDIRAVHRHYGDFYEKSNGFQGNNTIANATPLGTINVGATVTRGIDGATGTVVALNDDDFLSVDDNSDQDFFEFTVNDTVFANVTLTPVGQAYNQSPQGGGGGTPTDPSTSSNLTLALFNSSGSLITLVNEGTNGDPETIQEQILTPGDYFVRATGNANTVQLYTISVGIEQFVAPNNTPPSAVTLSSGLIAGGAVADLGGSDDQYLALIPDMSAPPSQSQVSALFSTFVPDNTPSVLSIDLEMGGNTANLEQSVSIFNTITNTFEELDNRSVSFTDTGITLTPAGNPQPYVSFATGLVLIDVTVETTGPVIAFPWNIRIDEFLVNTTD